MPQQIGMGSFSHFDPDNPIWTETSFKSVISALRKASLPELKLIRDLSYKFKESDRNPRMDLFKRLEFVLRENASPRTTDLCSRIGKRLEDTEILRFRVYPPDNDFDEYAVEQSKHLPPKLVVCCYRNGHEIEAMNRYEDYKPISPSPLADLKQIKTETLNSMGAGENMVFITLLWTANQGSEKNKFITELQSSPDCMLQDNYFLHSVHKQ
jgi:hypothetical protein